MCVDPVSGLILREFRFMKREMRRRCGNEVLTWCAGVFFFNLLKDEDLTRSCGK